MSELHQKREALRRSMRAKGQSTFDIRRVWIAHGPTGPVYGWQLRRWVGRFFPSSESSQHGSWEKALKAANDIARDEYIGNLEEWGVKPGDA